MEAREFGLMDKFISDAFSIPNAEKCFAKNENSAKDVPIKLVDLTGAFLILGIGLGLGILCFLIELIIGKYRREMESIRRNGRNEIAVKNRTRRPPIAEPTAVPDVEPKKGKIGKPSKINQPTIVSSEEMGNNLAIEAAKKNEATSKQVNTVVDIYNATRHSLIIEEKTATTESHDNGEDEELEVVELK